ncbi:MULTISPECIES: SDR family NAD(P)-dependent oxidoreductase [unclassified Devosia]|uniref:SDR family NAD(P)-dependent oxidoreductase n=1 Tax=unclassified Devosia TaxID=196773 RepID=UPI00086ED46B|nr:MULTISPECIES: SDR family NAD(P)-dependent oxidoreductase [unclassified Devosia]MBN9360584.1 SDR family oxidoreductase [Devosia sp.]ODS85446.1 MAG: short-chain dehydrogenase [Devosia sp. SCN 66-27]OJX22569.1 MAG: short-chain dehydrogenase [Devosia sp. 66-14]
MLIDLKGKVAVVTGAGRGIGRAIARTLAAEGVTVAIVDFRQDLLDDAAMEWTEAGWPGLRILCDVREAAQVNAAVGAVDEAFGRIDILVNNAGVASGARVDKLAEAVWDANFDTNTKGTFLMCQAVAPIMQRQAVGRILNAASFAAIIPSVGGAAYAASKSAVVQFSRVLAGELGPFNVTVNSYSPGMIPTEMNGFAKLPDARQERLLDTLTLRRWGNPEDVANLICFLASDQAHYITGASIDCSGGKYATQFPSAAYES